MIEQCQDCQSDRVLTITARAKDMHTYQLDTEEATHCYAAIFETDRDTTELSICLECGQVQGDFPHPPMFLEVGYTAQ